MQLFKFNSQKVNTLSILALFAFNLNMVSASELQVDYDVKILESSPCEACLNLEISMNVLNRSEQALKDLNIIAYPNRYQKLLPHLTDINYPRNYLYGGSKGSFTIEYIRQNGAELKPPREVEGKKWGSEWQNIILKKPVAPKTQTHLTLKGTLKFPDKLGNFGRYRKQLSAIGSWMPYVPSFEKGVFYPDYMSPKANWTFRSEKKSEVFWLNGKKLLPGQTVEFKQQRSLSLKKNKRKTLLHEYKSEAGQGIQLLHYRKESKKFHQSFSKLTKSLDRFLAQHPQSEIFSEKAPVFIQAPTREFLISQGTGSSFISDRTYRVINMLHSYHSIPIAQSYFFQKLMPYVETKESDKDVWWVTDALSWYFTDQFLNSREFENRDARDIWAVKAFSWLPSVDLLIHSPQFAFIDTFYNQVYPYDPNREHPFRRYTRYNFGRTVLEKSFDWHDEEEAHRIFKLYFDHKVGFRNLLRDSIEDGVDAERLLSSWLKPTEISNYKFGKVKHKRKSENLYTHKVELLRESKDVKTLSPESVTMKAFEKSGKVHVFDWKGSEAKKVLQFETESRLHRMELDPDKRVREFRRSDNDRPAYRKFVMNQLLTSYDFEEGVPIVFLSGQWRKKYGGPNRWTASGSYFGDAYGGSFGYRRLFGSRVDGLRLNYSLGLSVGLSRLARDNAFIETPSGFEQVNIGEAGNVTRITGSYNFGNQVSFTNPLEGGYGGVAVTWGTSYLGGDHDYVQGTLSGAWVFPIQKPNHLVSFRALLGMSGAGDVPSQVQYRLGGVTAMKGLPFNDERYQGKHYSLISGEYRHMLLSDIDINLGLFRIRQIQGALFTDVGRAVDTLEELAFNNAGETAPRQSDVKDLFGLADYEWDAGYGVRLHIDYFGVNPSLITFDWAKDLRRGNKPFFYFGVAQSF